MKQKMRGNEIALVADHPAKLLRQIRAEQGAMKHARNPQERAIHCMRLTQLLNGGGTV